MEQSDMCITQVIASLLDSMAVSGRCYIAPECGAIPPLAFHVDFPRLEIVLEGEICDGPFRLQRNDILFVPTGSWNCPQWVSSATTLSILFGKQQLGFSVQHWDGKQLKNVAALCYAVGLPITLAQLDIQDDVNEKMRIVAEAACAPGETVHNMQGGATVEQVYAALLVADKWGQQCLQHWE